MVMRQYIGDGRGAELICHEQLLTIDDVRVETK